MDDQAFDFDERVDFDDVAGDDDVEAEEQRLTLDTICVSSFAKLKLPPRKNVLDPILPERGLAMLFAGRGIGKTHVALGIAYAVSCGGERTGRATCCTSMERCLRRPCKTVC